MANRRTQPGTLPLAVLLVAGAALPCRAQILFEAIDPGHPVFERVDPGKARRKPIGLAPQPPRPGEPKPRLHRENPLPPHLHLAPLPHPHTSFENLRPTRIGKSPMLGEVIAPRWADPGPLKRGIAPGRRPSLEPYAPRETPAFDPRMEGHSRPTARFDSSIFLLPGPPSGRRGGPSSPPPLVRQPRDR